MAVEIDRQAIVDEEHLKLLSWGYYVSAGMAAFFSMLGVFYMFMGFAMGAAFSAAAQASSSSNRLPADFPMLFFGIFGMAIFLLAATVAVLKFVTGRKIRARKSRTLCMVIAAIGCLEFPYGIALGVATFIVLGRESVARLFAASALPAAKL